MTPYWWHPIDDTLLMTPYWWQPIDDTLLMTARSKVSDINSCNISNARILFDTGSQRNYITEELREKISLPTIREARIIRNTFGEEKSKACEVDAIQLKFNCYNNNNNHRLQIRRPRRPLWTTRTLCLVIEFEWLVLPCFIQTVFELVDIIRVDNVFS